jgi:rhodanese-related sulfurtransferase
MATIPRRHGFRPLPRPACDPTIGGSMSSANQTSVEKLLAEARAQLNRMSPGQAAGAVRGGAILVDIRSETQRRHNGPGPDSLFVPRNVLEWRLDAASPDALPELASGDRTVILICHEGYQSSLAAATVQRFGVDATDVVGGFQAWRGAGLPVDL